VLNLLLKYYGRNLYDHNIRIKFFDLIANNPELENSDSLRFNYFNFVAECYNGNFKHAYKFLINIREKYSHINPDFHQIWIDTNTQWVTGGTLFKKLNGATTGKVLSVIQTRHPVILVISQHIQVAINNNSTWHDWRA